MFLRENDVKLGTHVVQCCFLGRWDLTFVQAHFNVMQLRMDVEMLEILESGVLLHFSHGNPYNFFCSCFSFT